MKAMKNSVEQEGMRNAHIKDGIALTAFLAFLNNQVSYFDIECMSRTDASSLDL